MPEKSLNNTHQGSAKTAEKARQLKTALFFDCHNHTRNSPDSKCEIHDLCKQAIKNGLSGIAITDHCDVQFRNIRDILTPIKKSLEAAEQMKLLYKDSLVVFRGVEIGEAIWEPSYSEKILKLGEYDIVLGSVHSVRYNGYTDSCADINFTEMNGELRDDFLHKYFEDLLDLVKSFDFDVLTHLTYPFRYIIGKYGIKADISRYYPQIENILKEMINRRIALEVNTSCLLSGYDELMPNTEILKKYRTLGGELITIGSDSHMPQKVGKDFGRARDMLLDIGFKYAYYYVNRKPVKYALI